MKKFFLAVALSLVATFSANAEKTSFSETLSHSTLPIYVGKQDCGYKPVNTMFGPLLVWGCEFKTKFICTSTVIQAGGGNYTGLTAGHCFPDEATEKGWKFYVGNELSDHPVLHQITVIKAANETRYDYALFTFRSLENYTPISILTEGTIPAIGTDVENVNYSLGITKQVTSGKILSGLITGHEGDTEEAVNRYFVSIGIGPGASGSAIVDKKTNKIIGLVEAVFPGTQMATLVVPMGKNFKDFYQDDSAGLKPEKPKGPAFKWPDTPKAPIHVPTTKELVKELAGRVPKSVGIGVAVLLVLLGIRKLIRRRFAKRGING